MSELRPFLEIAYGGVTIFLGFAGFMMAHISWSEIASTVTQLNGRKLANKLIAGTVMCTVSIFAFLAYPLIFPPI